MSDTAPALLAAAAGVGFGHAILPDHWVPLAVLGRARRDPIGRIARLSGLAGVAHVVVSIVLGGVIIAIGLQFRSTVETAQDAIVGSILIATGIGFAALELAGRGHAHGHDHSHGPVGHAHHDQGPDGTREHGGHDDHAHRDGEHGHEHRLHGVAAVMVPFGAAASPDLTILPVFLAATTAGVATAIGSVVVFAAVTVGTIVGLTVLAARGGYEIRGEWLERWGNGVTAVTLVAIGTLVVTGVI